MRRDLEYQSVFVRRILVAPGAAGSLDLHAGTGWSMTTHQYQVFSYGLVNEQATPPAGTNLTSLQMTGEFVVSVAPGEMASQTSVVVPSAIRCIMFY